LPYIIPVIYIDNQPSLEGQAVNGIVSAGSKVGHSKVSFSQALLGLSAKKALASVLRR